jgi:hypothetical protein
MAATNLRVLLLRMCRGEHTRARVLSVGMGVSSPSLCPYAGAVDPVKVVRLHFSAARSCAQRWPANRLGCGRQSPELIDATE